MTGSRDERAEELLLAALALPPHEREAFVEARCKDDPSLLDEVKSLLPFADEPGRDDGFLASPVLWHGLLDDSRGAGLDAAPPDAGPLPERIGRFTIVRKISEGGMGIIFEARQTRPDRTVALKAIRPGLSGPGLERRFELEAEVLGRLRHPGIAHVYEAGVAETTDARGRRYRQPFFAMEYVQGQPLDHYCSDSGVDLRGRLRLFVAICDAVQHAHEHGVVHRDLKPANILVDAEGRPKILDFGVARVLDEGFGGVSMGTLTGQVLGTLPYMSPEQVAGDTHNLGARSDVYSLGVLLYEALAGRLPYEVRRRSLAEAARTIREEEPTRLGSVDTGLRGDVDTIVSRALEKAPERRYASARDLAQDILRHLQDRPIAARPPSTFYQVRKFARRNRALVGGTLATLLTLLVGTIVATNLAMREARKSEELERVLYRRALRSASAALGQGDRPLARELLGAEDVPAALRGWEWRHLWSRSGKPGVQITLPGPSSSAFLSLQVEDNALEYEGDGQGYRFDISTGEQLATWPLPRSERLEPHSWIRHAPDGEHYIIGTGTGKGSMVRLYDGEDHLCGEIPGRAALFSPPGSNLMVVPEASLQSLVWDLRSCTALVELPITFPVWTSDGSVLAGFGALTPEGNDGDYSLRTFDMPSGRERGRFPVDHGPRSVTLGPRDRIIVSGGYDGDIRLYDLSSGELLQRFEAHHDRILDVAFHPDGARVASAGSDGWVRIWALDTTRQLNAYRLETLAQQLHFLEDGRLVVARRDGSVSILDPEAREIPWVLKGHDNYVYAVAYHPSGRWFASADFGNGLVLWDARTGLQVAAFHGPQKNLYGLRFSRDGSRLISVSTSFIEGSRRRQVAVWDVQSRGLIAMRTLPPEPSLAGIGYPMDDAALRIALGWDPAERSITVWDVAGDEVSPEPLPRRLPAARRWVSPDGRFVAKDRPEEQALDVMDLSTGSVQRLPPAGAYMVLAFSYGLQGPVRVAAPLQSSTDAEEGGETLGIWEARTGRLLGELRGHTREVLVVLFSPDDSRIVTGSRDGTIRIWDGATLEELLLLEGHSFYVKDLAFSPDRTQLVSASGDQTLRVWDGTPPI